MGKFNRPVSSRLNDEDYQKVKRDCEERVVSLGTRIRQIIHEYYRKEK